MIFAETATGEAARWLIELETSEGLEDIRPEFAAWLARDRRNSAAFLRMARVSRRLDRLRGLSEEELQRLIADRETVAARLFDAFGLSRSLLAAAVALVATILSCLIVWYISSQSVWKTYRTAVGEQQQIGLVDGSTVTLNTDSELSVRLNASERDVVLRRGEALFRVAHDPKRPFLVTARTTVARAVGTEFSVRIREDNRVEVFVTEGLVAIGTSGSNSTERPFSRTSTTAVAAGEIASIAHDQVAVKRIRKEEISRKLSWTTGLLIFAGETLSEAVSEFNRYTLQHVIVADPSIVNVTIGGSFRPTDSAAFVAALERIAPVIAIPAPGGELRLIAAPRVHIEDIMPPVDETPRAAVR